MFYIRRQIVYFTYLLLLEVRLLHAQKSDRTSINEDGAGVQKLGASTLFDVANMGFPNFAPERFRNLGSNYPTGSPFFPFGNQFPNFQRFGPDYGWGLGTQYPNQRNDQGPQKLNQNQGVLPDHRGVFRLGLNTIFDPSSHKINTYQNYPVSVPDDVSFRINRPDGNEGSYQPGHHNPGESLQFLTSNRNPNEDNNFVPDSNYYPDARSQMLNRPTNYPMENTPYPDDNRVYQNQNQYPTRHNFQNRKHPNFQTTWSKTLPPYSSDFPNTQNYQNNQGRANVNQPVHSLNQIPIQRGMENNDGSNFNEGSFNDAARNIPKLPDQQADSGATDPDRKVAILGKPVIVPPDPTEPSDVDKERSKNAIQKQCVQDCETTSEYNPICGTNNVTYINPGKFACARNCGVDLYVSRYGRCKDDPASNYARQ